MVGRQQPAAETTSRAVMLILCVGTCNRTHETSRYRQLLWLVIAVIWRRLLFILVIEDFFWGNHVPDIITPGVTLIRNDGGQVSLTQLAAKCLHCRA